MAIDQRERLYEVLLRYSPGAGGGLTVNAHQIRLIEIVDTDTGEVITTKEGLATPLAIAEVAAVVGEAVPSLLAERAALRAEVAQVTADRAAERAALNDALVERTGQRDAAVAALATCEAERDGAVVRVAELEAMLSSPG